jgi:hypothetical protein
MFDSKNSNHEAHEAREEESINQRKSRNESYICWIHNSIDRHASIAFFFVRFVSFVFKFLSCFSTSTNEGSRRSHSPRPPPADGSTRPPSRSFATSRLCGFAFWLACYLFQQLHCLDEEGGCP